MSFLKSAHAQARASIEWVPDPEIPGKTRMVVNCKNHGITDDIILVEIAPGRSRYCCRLCQTIPCEIHGEDYVTVIGKGSRQRQVCIICDRDALMIEADSRNNRRTDLRNGRVKPSQTVTAA